MIYFPSQYIIKMGDVIEVVHYNSLIISRGLCSNFICDSGMIWDTHQNKILFDPFTPFILSMYGFSMDISDCCQPEPCETHIRELAYKVYKEKLDKGETPNSADFNWYYAKTYLSLRADY